MQQIDEDGRGTVDSVSAWGWITTAIYMWVAVVVAVALLRNRQGERRALVLTVGTVMFVAALGLGAVLLAMT